MSSVRHRVSAAILAGGRATRLGGVDKAALLIGGTRIIDRQIAELTAVADDLAIIANDPTRYAGFPIPVHPDAMPGAGALGGIYTALARARHDRVLIVACDLPFVTRALLARLVEEAGDDVDAVVPRSRRGLEPLCALYTRRCMLAIEARIARGALGVADLAAELRVQEIGADALVVYDPDGRLFVNVNTPHDYVRATEAEMSKPLSDRITEEQ
jgi:molybdopterin-guanine dinucleotide biosynthesis protein A